MILKYIIFGILIIAVVYILSTVQMVAWLRIIDQFLNKKHKENEKEEK